jgi:integrase/recombinase XerC
MEAAGIASLARCAARTCAASSPPSTGAAVAASLQRGCRRCASLCRHLVARGELAGNPAQGLRAPKAARKLPQVLDADEDRALVEVPPIAARAPRPRHARAVLFLRPAPVELCALRWRELDLAEAWCA